MRDLQVPVIVVFTKYDQFRREVRMKLEDQNPDAVELDADAEAERVFVRYFLANLGESPFVRLGSEYLLTS
jgi:hypothetical protein